MNVWGSPVVVDDMNHIPPDRLYPRYQPGQYIGWQVEAAYVSRPSVKMSGVWPTTDLLVVGWRSVEAGYDHPYPVPPLQPEVYVEKDGS